MTIPEPLREVAEALAEEYGWSVLDDRLRIIEWLDTRGLLASHVEPTAEDTDAIDDVESHIRWYLT